MNSSKQRAQYVNYTFGVMVFLIAVSHYFTFFCWFFKSFPAYLKTLERDSGGAAPESSTSSCAVAGGTASVSRVFRSFDVCRAVPAVYTGRFQCFLCENMMLLLLQLLLLLLLMVFVIMWLLYFNLIFTGVWSRSSVCVCASKQPKVTRCVASVYWKAWLYRRKGWDLDALSICGGHFVERRCK